MITLRDMNQSWTQPEGFDFVNLEPCGGWLVATFQEHHDGDDVVRGWTVVVKVYLQEMGREVARTTETILDPVVEFQQPEKKPIPARFKFWGGWLLVLAGLEEMIKCHKK